MAKITKLTSLLTLKTNNPYIYQSSLKYGKSHTISHYNINETQTNVFVVYGIINGQGGCGGCI